MIVVIVSRQRYWTSMTKGKQSAVPLSSALVRHVDSLHILASKQLVLLCSGNHVECVIVSLCLLSPLGGEWSLEDEDTRSVSSVG